MTLSYAPSDIDPAKVQLELLAGSDPANDNPETTDPVTPDPAPVEPTPNKLSGLEEQAVKLGWQPEGTYEGDADRFVPAGEILKDKRYQKELKGNRVKIAKLEDAVTQMMTHQKSWTESQFKTIRAEMQATRNEHIRDGEDEKAAEIEQKLEELTEEHGKLADDTQVFGVPDDQEPKVSPDFDWFLDRNPWYNDDQQKTEYADFLAAKLRNENTAGTDKEFYLELEKRMRAVFPVGSTNAPVEGGGSPAPRSRKVTVTMADLTDQERDLGNEYARRGIMTLDEFLKTVADIRKEL